jgi:hypothetical protein
MTLSRRTHRTGILLAVTFLASTALASVNARAGELVSSLEFSQDAGCQQLHVRLSEAVSFDGSAMSGVGKSIDIPVERVANSSPSPFAITAPLPQGSDLVSAKLTGDDGSSATLQIGFGSEMRYAIVMEAETRHIRIDVARADSPAGCVAAATRTAEIAAPVPSPTIDDSEQAGEVVSALRPAIVDDAKALGDGDVPVGAAELADAAMLESNSAKKVSLDDNTGSLAEKSMLSPTLRTLRKIKDPVVDPAQWVWSNHGRVGQTAYTSGKVSRETDNMSRGVSHFSYTMKGSNASHAVALQLDASNRAELGGGGKLFDGGVNTLSATWEDKDHDVLVRVGRQSRQDSGIFGRFDGAMVQWGATDKLTLGLTAGSPAYTRDQMPFKDDRYFVAASVDYVFPDDSWQMQIYAVEQRAKGLVDRRALGGSLSYRDEILSAIAGLDYDIYQNKMASAFGSANWQVNSRLSASASIDYLTQPLLLTSNALAEQDANSLDDLIDEVGEDRLKDLAADRTAESISAAFGLVYQVNDHWQVSGDAFWSYVTGTPASGGVAATQALGSEWMVMTRASGHDVVVEGDSLGFGANVRLAQKFTELSVDGSWQVPVTEQFKMGGRMRVGTRFHDDGSNSLFAAPRLTGEYKLDKSWLINGELGALIDNRDSTGSGASVDVLALIGLHFEF